MSGKESNQEGPHCLAGRGLGSITSKSVLIVKDAAEADEGLRSLEDLLNIAGIKLTTTLDSDQTIAARVEQFSLVVFLSSNKDVLSKLINLASQIETTVLVPVSEGTGKVVVKYFFGHKASWSINCGVLNRDGRWVHVGTTSSTTDNRNIVVSDRPHGLQAGDIICFAEDKSQQEVCVETIISDVSFLHSSSQVIKQGYGISLVRGRKWPTSTEWNSCFQLGENQVHLEDPEVVGFLADQVIRVLVCPGLVKNPSPLSFDPLRKDNFDGASVLVVGCSYLGQQLQQLLSKLQPKRLVLAVNKDSQINSNSRPESRNEFETLEYSASTDLTEFDLIFCCGGNFDSRLSLGERCVEAQKPLITLAQDSFNGQIESFVPHQTVSYSCLRDPSDHDPPHCILKSFPHRAEHSAVWADEKVKRILENKPTATNNFIQEHKGNPESLARRLAAGLPPEGSREAEFFRASVGSHPTWEKCVIAARLKFEKYFCGKASQLITTFPPHHTVSDGSLFWSWPKLQPRPVCFDLNDTVHTDFVSTFALSLATIHGVPIPETVNIKPILSNLVVPPFVAKNKTVVTDESMTRDAASGVNDGERDLSGLVEYVAEAEPLQAQPSNHLRDKLTVLFTFLRCDMYGIPRPKAEEVEVMCEKRQLCWPALSLQLAKLAVNTASCILGGGRAECVWLCGGEKIVYQTPQPARTEHLGTTVWDVWEMQGRPELTLQQFLEAVLEKYKIKVNLVVQGSRMVYILAMPTHKIRLCKPMAELLKNPDNSKFVSLVLMASIDGVDDDVTLPKLRYYF